MFQPHRIQEILSQVNTELISCMVLAVKADEGAEEVHHEYGPDFLFRLAGVKKGNFWFVEVVLEANEGWDGKSIRVSVYSLGDDPNRFRGSRRMCSLPLPDESLDMGVLAVTFPVYGGDAEKLYFELTLEEGE